MEKNFLQYIEKIHEFLLKQPRLHLQKLTLSQLLDLITCQMKKAKNIYLKSRVLDPQIFGSPIFLQALRDFIQRNSGKINIFTGRIIKGLAEGNHPLIDLIFPHNVDPNEQAYVYKNLIYWYYWSGRLIWPGLDYFFFSSDKPLAIVLEPYNLTTPLKSLWVNVTEEAKIIRLLSYDFALAETNPYNQYLYQKNGILIRTESWDPSPTDLDKFRKIKRPPGLNLKEQEQWFIDSYLALGLAARKESNKRSKAYAEAIKTESGINC